MANTLDSALEELRDSAALLQRRHLELKEEMERLRSENEELRSELQQTRSELDKARTDAHYLTMSHRLADNPDTLVETRRHIARLIRTIDSCMDMLKE